MENTGLDYLAAFGTAVGALAAAAAVAVAVLGPRLEARRRQPRVVLSSTAPLATYYFYVDSPSAEGAALLKLRNEPGRDTAREVEVFLSVDAVGGPLIMGKVTLVSVEPLNFDDPVGGERGRSTANLPPGFARSLDLLIVGHFEAIAAGTPLAADLQLPEDKQKTHAAWALAPARQDRLRWLRDGERYFLTLTVTGANFDAQSYRGTVGITLGEVHEDAANRKYQGVDVQWLEPLIQTGKE